MKQTLGERLRELRKKSHYSLEEVANRLEISIDELKEIEENKKAPSLEMLVKLSDLYGLTLEELTSGKSRSHKDKSENINIDINFDNINISNSNKKTNRNYETKLIKKDVIKDLVLTLGLSVVTIIYLILGFTLPNNEGWMVYWTLFLIPFIVESIVEVYYSKKIIKFNIVFLSTFIYLFLGMYLNLWHPTWVVFISIPMFYSVVSSITRLIKINNYL